ncbi:hypothetical protein A2U01_0007205 [Trifolium medium]|uniref:Uncharacterized protein n=1 Tax=Trifolium medium TaxID=97028 RepID=A0A392MH35_9FABA|nr:hypothetical protein [Trifolium medium]
MGMREEQSVKMTAVTAGDGEATVTTKMVREEKEADRENKMKSETGWIFESSPPQKLVDVSSPVGYCWERIPPQPKPPYPPNLLKPPDTDLELPKSTSTGLCATISLTLQPPDTGLPPSTVLSRRGPPPEPPDTSPPQSRVTNVFTIVEDSISDESRMCTLLKNHNNSSKWGQENKKWAGSQLLKQAQNKVRLLNNTCVQKIHVTHRFFSFNPTRVITRWKPNGKPQTECPVLPSSLVRASPLLGQSLNMYFSLGGISVSAAYLMQTPTLSKSSPLRFPRVHSRSSPQALVVCVPSPPRSLVMLVSPPLRTLRMRMLSSQINPMRPFNACVVIAVAKFYHDPLEISKSKGKGPDVDLIALHQLLKQIPSGTILKKEGQCCFIMLAPNKRIKSFNLEVNVSGAALLIWVAKEKEESCSYSSFGIEVLTKGFVVGERLLPKSTFINGYAHQERI